MLLPILFAAFLGQTTFTVPNGGGVSTVTDGSGSFTAGFGQAQPDAGGSIPATFTLLDERIGGVLVNETGIPVSQSPPFGSPLFGGRIYVAVSNTVTTGVAMVASVTTATVNFHLTDTNGATVSSGTLTIPPNQQVSKLLTEAPFNAGNSFQGTLTYSTTGAARLTVSALRGHLNERNEFLWSSLPIADPQVEQPPVPATVVVPHFVDGQGWTTQIVLVNPTDSIINGVVQFFSQGSIGSSGTPVTVTANGQTASGFPYSIPAESSFTLATSGAEPSGTVLSGSVQVMALGGGIPSAFAIYSYKNSSGTTVSEAIGAGTVSPAFRMFVDETSPTPAFPAIQSGFAVANGLSFDVTATLNLTALDGSPIASTTIPIPANGQIAKMLHDVFPNIMYPFQGVLSIRSSATNNPIAASALALRVRYNERGDPLMTTTTMTQENVTGFGTAPVIPQFLNGGGWTTQLILFSGSNGQATSGQLTFTKSNGSPFNVTLK
jgi:hypothetical protein